MIKQWPQQCHYNDVIMDSIASQITGLTIIYSVVYSGADQRKHQSSASLAFVRGIHPNKWPVTRKKFPFDDVIMWTGVWLILTLKRGVSIIRKILQSSCRYDIWLKRYSPILYKNTEYTVFWPTMPLPGFISQLSLKYALWIWASS